MTAPGAFELRRLVGWTDVDPSENYQFSAALRYVEEAGIAMLRELGVFDELYPHLPRTLVRADFRRPAHFGDEVTVLLRVGRIGRSSVEYDFELRHGAPLCAEGTLGSANVGAANVGAAPLPDGVVARLSRHAAGGPRRAGIVGEREQVVHGNA